MASSGMHLAVAKEYLKKYNNIKNTKDFLNGTLYPDSVQDKVLTHYTTPSKNANLVKYLQNKVNLFEFLQKHPDLTDFELGWFLHIVTDYLFFDEMFSDEYLENVSYKKFKDDLYFSYSCLRDYLAKKYDVTKADYIDYPNLYFDGGKYEPCLISKNSLDKFIERVCSIDLEKYIQKIIEAKNNIKP